MLVVKEEILAHIHDPRHLEKLYRSNKLPFKRAFSMLYPELKGNVLADFWNERLNYETDEVSRVSRTDLLFVIIASLIAGFITKLPVILHLEQDIFFGKNIGFIIFPALAAYFIWKNQLQGNKIALIAGAMLAGLLFINTMPFNVHGDTFILSCVHLVVFLWFLFGVAFVGTTGNDVEKRLAFLKYNGDLVVITTLILIAGGIMTGITVGLFSLIGFDIKDFFVEYVIKFGLAAAPLIGNYLIQYNPQLVSKVSPVIARIFSPLVLVMLVIYLVAMAYAGKNPYSDRDFLTIFNALLLGVMAIIFFAVSDASKSRAEVWILFLLSLVTLVVNAIALSAIILRISDWGVSVNRMAVLGADVLIFLNLLLVTAEFFWMLTKRNDLTGVRKVIAVYLPVYFIWAIIVTFIFPFIFGLS